MVDLSKYRRVNFEYIKTWLSNNPDKEIKKTISEISLATNVPLIAVCYFVLEIIGPDEEVQNMAKSLMKFYGIIEVIGHVVNNDANVRKTDGE